MTSNEKNPRYRSGERAIAKKSIPRLQISITNVLMDQKGSCMMFLERTNARPTLHVAKLTYKVNSNATKRIFPGKSHMVSVFFYGKVALLVSIEHKWRDHLIRNRADKSAFESLVQVLLFNKK